MTAKYTVSRLGDQVITFRRGLELPDAEAYAQSRSLWHKSVMIVTDAKREVVSTYISGERQ